MRKIGTLETARANKNILGEVVSYLMVTAAAVRGLVGYPEFRLQIAGLLAIFIFMLLAEPLLRRQTRWGQPFFLIAQIAIMIGLFLYTPFGDFWAILLMPGCIYVMRQFRPRIAWTWIVVFMIAISIMIIIGEGLIYAPEFIVVYVAAYILVGSYAFMLRQTEDAQKESQLLLGQLQQVNAQLQDYVAQVEELTTMKERNRLARELHDAVTQSIFSMTLITRSALILQDRDPTQVKDKLLQLQELAQEALQEMRGLIYQLRTFSVEEDGLYPVLQKFIEGVNGRNNLQISLDSASQPLPLTPIQQQELYRIIQEAVNNIVKHSQAGLASIQFEVMDTAVSVIVTDDGVGFEPTRLNNEGTHIGLDSMLERAEELGGTLAVNARPGAGTEIKVTVPIADQREPNE